MKHGTVRNWYLVHKWTSLLCTVFLLMLCITGLPLIFWHEIEELTGRHPEVKPVVAATAPANLDQVLKAGVVPGGVPLYLSFDDEDPILYVNSAPSLKTPPEITSSKAYDARSGEEIVIPPFNEGFMWIIFRLHTDLFAGLPGMLFLGGMGALFVVSIVSGVVVYGPFMRKLDFGTVRTSRSSRLKWLDLHNLLGIVTLSWAAVVGFTGVINTLSDPLISAWQNDQLAEMVSAYKTLPPPTRFGSVQAAVETAKAAAPGMTPSFVAFPGTPYSSPHHYAVYMHGETALTSKLYTPALIDVETGKLTDMRSMPWYIQGLFLSQPLHFGDYGGTPLKILWAVLDVISIVVLGSGLYLWLGKRRSSLEARLKELETGGAATPAMARAGDA